MMSDNVKNCYLYVLDTLSDWEIGYLTAELNSKRYIPGSVDINFIFVGDSLNSIKTMGGLTIFPDSVITQIDFKEGDLLILPGAGNWMTDENNSLSEIVKELIQKKVIIAAICGATIFLARLGLLNNRTHTSNNLSYLEMVCPNYKGSLFYREESVVVDENVITGTGISPLEFSYEIFKKMKLMREETLEAWYQLYQTKDPEYFMRLIESIK